MSALIAASIMAVACPLIALAVSHITWKALGSPDRLCPGCDLPERDCECGEQARENKLERQ
jgi:hypothetical protein